MDLLRSCYTARWYPYPGRPDLYWDVRWYEVPADRPWLPFPTIWRSSNWDELTDVLTPGERADTARWCPPGPPFAEPIGAPIACGPPALWAGELPADPNDLVGLALDPESGVPLCCGPQLLRLRGGGVGGGRILERVNLGGLVRGGGVGGGLVAVIAVPPIVAYVVAGGGVGGGRLVLTLSTSVAGGGVGGGLVLMAVNPTRDPYFGDMPGMWHLGCGLTGIMYEGWLVAGADGTIPTDPTLPSPDVIVWTPLMTYDPVTILAGAVVTGSESGEGGGLLRVAVYRNAGDRCAYPGDLLLDAGVVGLAADAVQSIPDLAGLALEGNKLYWLATWFSGGMQMRCLAAPGVAGPRPYPVAGFESPLSLRPMAGLGAGLPYGSPMDAPWPDPVDPGAFGVDVEGTTVEADAYIGMPAIWLQLQNTGGGPITPIVMVVAGGGVGGGDLEATVILPQLVAGGGVGGGDLEEEALAGAEVAGGGVGGGDLADVDSFELPLAGGGVGGGDLEASAFMEEEVAGGGVGGGDLEEE